MQYLVYGGSIFLAGLASQLQACPGVWGRCRSALTDLGDLTTLDAVSVDLNDCQAADGLLLLRARPDLRGVGLNATTSAVTVRSGQVYLAQTGEELLACLTS